jgi:hypothetical protein
MLTDTQTHIDISVLDHADSRIGESIGGFIVAKQQAMDEFWSREADGTAKFIAGIVITATIGAGAYVLWMA